MANASPHVVDERVRELRGDGKVGVEQAVITGAPQLVDDRVDLARAYDACRSEFGAPSTDFMNGRICAATASGISVCG
jgi:HEAT repeat protein